MKARWAVVAFGAGALLGAMSLPGWLVLARRARVRHATDSVTQAVRTAMSTGPTDPHYGLGQGGMEFGVYEPGPFGTEPEQVGEHTARPYDAGGSFGIEDYVDHRARFPRTWCPYCYGSGCRRCHGIGEVAP